ncbi:hypothetical protein [Subtercola vilae]|uniref:Head decoration protein n=1 Tax=Subtercola vilae TaxID=2056433 RepID=A0A4T2BRY3_9MICO|nr:hypothetical protein [Subtercola vilae]TIH33682.1 hypothetical protein D4765_14460 [Subtercola vilae]
MTFYGDFVVPAALASPTDLAAWTGAAAPANAANLLRSATILVLDATESAYYAIDPLTGLATNAQTKQALNDATCIQVAAWLAFGYDPLSGGVMVAGVASSSGIGSARETYADALFAAQAKADAVTGLVPEATRVLRRKNLLVPQAWTFG